MWDSLEPRTPERQTMRRSWQWVVRQMMSRQGQDYQPRIVPSAPPQMGAVAEDEDVDVKLPHSQSVPILQGDHSYHEVFTDPESHETYPKKKPDKLRRKRSSPHRRNRTEPPGSRSRWKSIQLNLDQLKNMNIKGLAQTMPRKVIKQLKPTRIPVVKRSINWCKTKWPGHPQYKGILHSPYFFLYVISLSLVQAFLSAVSSKDIMISDDLSVGSLVSLVFFILYIIEVLFRLYIKGFNFFLQIYNLAEVSLTLTAFIIDLRLTGTSFVANVLSLRIIWCIHRVPGMSFIVEGIKKAAPRISVIIFPFAILIYVFAVITTTTLGPMSYQYNSPDYWLPNYRVRLSNGTTIKVKGAALPYDYYGDITKSMFTLFQVMTGDAWADQIARPTMLTRPWSFILFVIFYSLFTFILLNIFTGIMVDAIQSFEQESRNRKLLEATKKIATDLKMQPIANLDENLSSPENNNENIDSSNDTLANTGSGLDMTELRPKASVTENSTFRLERDMIQIKEQMKQFDEKIDLLMRLIESKVSSE